MPAAKNDISPWLKIVKEVTLFRQYRLHIGVPLSKGVKPHPDSPDRTVAEIGLMGEMGVPAFIMNTGHVHPGVPMRSYLRRTFTEYKKTIVRLLVRQSRMVFAGKRSAQKAWEVMGESIVKLVDRTMMQANSWAEPLAAKTLAKKRRKNQILDTLRATDTLRTSLGWTIRDVNGRLVSTGAVS